jgi:hypothetical protein
MIARVRSDRSAITPTGKRVLAQCSDCSQSSLHSFALANNLRGISAHCARIVDPRTEHMRKFGNPAAGDHRNFDAPVVPSGLAVASARARL